MIDPTTAVERMRAAFYGAAGEHRTLHSWGTWATGSFTATPRAAELGTAAHLQGTPVPVLVRFSNGSGNPQSPDKTQDVRGLGVRFDTSAGPTFLVSQTAGHFPVNDPDKFVAMTEALADPKKPWKAVKFLSKNPKADRQLIASGPRATKPPRSWADCTYYPVHAYGWIAPDGTKRWVRYVWRPLDSGKAAKPHAKDYLEDELTARLAVGPVRFELEVSVASESDDPHDTMSTWKPAEVFIAGTLTVDTKISDPEEGGEVVVFDPTVIIDGIELSNDPILLYRKEAYAASARYRQNR